MTGPSITVMQTFVDVTKYVCVGCDLFCSSIIDGDGFLMMVIVSFSECEYVIMLLHIIILVYNWVE